MMNYDNAKVGLVITWGAIKHLAMKDDFESQPWFEKFVSSCIKIVNFQQKHLLFRLTKILLEHAERHR